MVANKKLYKILLIIILVLIQNKVNSGYTTQPVLLIHGRGMHSGDNWDKIDNETGGKLLDYLSSYGIIYYYDSFSGQGYGALENWGNELVTWINNFKTEYENRTEHPEFTKFRLVSYSAGGLASRWYLANNGIQKIERLITLNTPHQGAYLGIIGEIFSYGDYIFFCLATIYGLLALNPILSATYLPASAICFGTGTVIYITKQIFSGTLLPPNDVTNNIDYDLYPISPFFLKLKTLESFPINQYKIKYKITSGRGAPVNVGKLQAELFTAVTTTLAVPGSQIVAVPLFLAFAVSLLDNNGDLASLVDSQEGTDQYPFGPWYINQSSDFDKTVVKTEKNHFNITHDGKLIIKLLEDASILSIENSNTLTAVKMEPDGAYINIQHPIIHIDGSCDDYLIQWMGNERQLKIKNYKFSIKECLNNC